VGDYCRCYRSVFGALVNDKMSKGKKWLIITLLVVLVLGSCQTKKESVFSFRCSEDLSSVQIFNKVTGGFDTWESCTGECGVIAGSPTCINDDDEKKASPESNNAGFLLLLAGLLWLITKKEVKRE